MADAEVLKTSGGNPVRVRIPPSAPAVQSQIPYFQTGNAGFGFGCGSNDGSNGPSTSAEGVLTVQQ